MARVTLDGVTKTFGDFTAVRTMALEVADGEFVAILGPSGCGKTTTMNMIAGLETPTTGAVLFDGADVTRTPIQKRGVGFVFQNYATFTHMSVRKNLAFGLEVRGTPQAEVDRRVGEMAEFMALSHRLDAPSASLSVNELQKLAIGRSAIVEPRIFLLDEPLSNLDAAFRERMRADLRDLQRSLKQTMVYVTHDQIEAMGLADRIAVMSQGDLQQFDTPAAIYARPANTFVARFIGAPSMNLLAATIERTDGGPAARLADGQIVRLGDGLARGLGQRADILLGFRPETLALVDAPGEATLAATVRLVETIGRRRIAHLALGGETMLGVFERTQPVRAGETVRVALDRPRCHLFDAESGVRLDPEREEA
ncbi:MAG: ABC transporter ATP-binding protein [Pseudomonadota bacterium]